ncbi:hypothetical protein EJB05_24382, partial [Eragrostis curvula]
MQRKNREIGGSGERLDCSTSNAHHSLPLRAGQADIGLLESLGPPVILSSRRWARRWAWSANTKVIGVTAGGRLALAISKEVFFINPVTDVSKTLNVMGVPGCTGLAGDGGDTVLSHDNEVVSHHGPHGRTRLYCREREHGSEEWSCVAVRDVGYYFSGISSLAKCNGVVHVLYWDGSMAKINTKARQPLVIRDLYCFTPWRRQEDHSLASNKDYLLESDGEVLFVRQLLRQKAKTCPCDYHCLYETVGFEVYKLDEIGRQWEKKVEMLDGDRALFVSTRSSFSVRASQTAGCRSNCIYFVRESQHCVWCHENCMSTWGVYSMEQGMVLFEHTVVVTERRTVARWFRPNVVWASHERA